MGRGTHDALLRAVCATPADDAPRLIYADWLEEHGNLARAEFIRAQIEREACEENTARFEELQAREKELLAAHAEEWEKGFLAGSTGLAIRDMWGEATYRRGFPARVFVVQCDLFPEEADRFFERVPADEVLLKWTYPPDWDSPDWNENSKLEEGVFGRLLHSSAVDWLTGLKTVGRGHGLDGLDFWFKSAYAPRLVQVDTHDCDYYGSQIATLLANSPGLSGLRWMDLAGNQMGDEGLRQLAGAPHLTGVRTLLLGIDAGDATNDLSDAGIADLAQSPSLTRLEKLDLDGNEDVGDGAARAIAGSVNFSNLRDLNLGYCRVGAEGVIALANSPHLANLRRLGLACAGMTDEAAIALIESPYLSNLVYLDLEGAGDSTLDSFVSDEGARRLRERFGRRVKGLGAG